MIYLEIFIQIEQSQKVDEFVDSGGWGSSAGECGGKPDQIITWGGPIATFRWGNAKPNA
jgi:hypothetical protein